MSDTIPAPPPAPAGVELDRQIGSGSFGEVWLGHQVPVGGQVAVKYFRPNQVGGATWTEGELAASLRDNPNVVPVLWGGTATNGMPYLVMMFMPRGSLKDRVDQVSDLGCVEIVSIGIALSDALADAHRHDILHLDVSPGNVLFDNSNRARLADFGLARRTQTPLGSPTGFAGTPAYCAPEVFEGRQSKASDVWAMGAVLRTALVGEPPFGHGDLKTLKARIVSEQPARVPPGLPDEVRSVLDECLAKDPAHRPTAEEIHQRLVKSAAGVHAQSIDDSKGTRSTGSDGNGTAATAYEQCAPSVLSIWTDFGSGSGVVVASDGLVATNAHVVAQCTTRSIRLVTTDGRSAEGTILKRIDDGTNDLAFVQISDGALDDIRPIRSSPSVEIRQGIEVFALGYPFGADGGTACSITNGIVSQIEDPDHVRWVRHTAAINFGNSGGPLVNSAGRIVAINTKYRQGAESFYYGIHAETLGREIELLRKEQSARPNATHCLACGGISRVGGECTICHQPDVPPATSQGNDHRPDGGPLRPRVRSLGPRQTRHSVDQLLKMMAFPDDTTTPLALPRPPAGSRPAVVDLAFEQMWRQAARDLTVRTYRSVDLAAEIVASGSDQLSGQALRFAAGGVGEAVFLLRMPRLAEAHTTTRGPTPLRDLAMSISSMGAALYGLWARLAPDARRDSAQFDWWAHLLDRELSKLQGLPDKSGELAGLRVALWRDNQMRSSVDQEADQETRKREASLTALLAIRGYIEAMDRHLISTSSAQARQAKRTLDAGHSDLRQRIDALGHEIKALHKELGVS